MLGLQGSREEVIPGLAHRLSSWSLGLKGMSFLHTLTQVKSKVFFDDGSGTEWDLVRSFLDAIQFGCQNSESIVFGIGDKKCKVNEMVRVGEFSEKLKMLGHIRGGIFQGCQDEDSFFIQDSFSGRLDWVQVDMLDAGGLDFERSVAIEHDGCLQMGVPSGIFILRHIQWWLGRTPAIET